MDVFLKQLAYHKVCSYDNNDKCSEERPNVSWGLGSCRNCIFVELCGIKV